MIYLYSSRGPDPPISPPNQKRRGAPLHPLNMLPPNRSMSRLECLREEPSEHSIVKVIETKKPSKTSHSHFRTVRFPRPPALGSVQDFPGSSLGQERYSFTYTCRDELGSVMSANWARPSFRYIRAVLEAAHRP